MSDGTDDLLTAMQFGDGQFPGGGFAFSWGLETLAAEGLVQRHEFAAFVEGQLRQRWATFDRILVAHAHQAANDSRRLTELDELADALMIVSGARFGSRRAGAALLGTHARLGTPGAAALKTAVDEGRNAGHFCVVQGAVLAGVGLDQRATLAVSAYGLAQALCTAAIRLGLIGHLDAQRTLSLVRPLTAALIRQPPGTLDEICSFVPVTDIAMMRHADQALRLFSN